MARLWTGGASQTAIAEQFGAGQVTVSRVLRRHGIKPERRIARRERVAGWKGGRTKTGGGSWLVRAGFDHRFASMCNQSGYILEHRLVMARLLDRPLKSSEHVHHIDGDRENNDPSNLQLRQSHHGKGVVYRCRCCGSNDIESIPITEKKD